MGVKDESKGVVGELRKDEDSKADTRGIESRTYGVNWLTCVTCGLTDPTVTGQPPTHPHVATCMAMVTKGVLGSHPLKLSETPFAQVDLDEAEEKALVEAVVKWKERQPMFTDEVNERLMCPICLIGWQYHKELRCEAEVTVREESDCE